MKEYAKIELSGHWGALIRDVCELDFGLKKDKFTPTYRDPGLEIKVVSHNHLSRVLPGYGNKSDNTTVVVSAKVEDTAKYAVQSIYNYYFAHKDIDTRLGGDNLQELLDMETLPSKEIRVERLPESKVEENQFYVAPEPIDETPFELPNEEYLWDMAQEPPQQTDQLSLSTSELEAALHPETYKSESLRAKVKVRKKRQ